MLLTAFRVAAVWTLLHACFGWQHAEATTKSHPLVSVEAGDLPIILSAPHGGSAAIPGVPVRKGEGVSQFKTATDMRTARLTEKLADALQKQLGKRPYVVIARFHRKYLDANRSANGAYESENAQAAYDAYHQALTDARQDVQKRFGHGILFDIHGQASKPQAIIRGTQNGETTTHLISRFGQEAQLGRSSLFGQLAKQGFPIIPAVDSTAREHPNYDGGYIVWTYGSRTGGTVDAIQLEVGKDLRSAKAIDDTAQRIADAMTAFAGVYLPQEEQASEADDEPQPSGKIRVGLYRDQGTGKSVERVVRTLNTFESVSVKQLTAEKIRSGALDDFDLVIHPGGSGSGQGRHLGEDGRAAIREFVQDGGGYIGICAGAYLASADYDWSLHILDAKVLDRKHWARGQGDVKIGLTEAGKDLLHTKESQLTIRYAQGPLLAPANQPKIDDYQTIATFETEIAKNGAPKGVMKGTTAIALGQFGKGRVICFSPHPELTEGLEVLVYRAIERVKRNDSQRASTP